MSSRKQIRWLLWYAPASGLLLAGGCLATIQGNLDLLLGADAFENTLRLPYSAVAQLAELLWGALRG